MTGNEKNLELGWNTVSGANAVTMESGYTLGRATVTHNGRMASLFLRFTAASALTSGTYYTIGTLAEGFRPIENIGVIETYGANVDIFVRTDGMLRLRPNAAMAANKEYCFMTCLYII